MKIYLNLLLVFIAISLRATDYHVGPGQAYTNINDVPWESMNAGDKVFIHHRSMPYNEKWVINVQGTSSQPFEVIGVLGPGGERPIISGDGATTRTQLSYWNENRSVIKVGGSSIPSDGLPSHIIIENLEVRSGHKNYNFTDDNGNSGTYVNNAASIHVEKVNHLTIRNCKIHDSGNGIFIGNLSSNILIESNYIHGNGNVGRFFEHNTYTEANSIIYQFNRFGPLRPGADGNNLKDRSSGLVVRYNWIEGGNRLLDLVETSSTSIMNDPEYRKTYVYGNILIEEDGGNNQVIHYGGDNGNTTTYRKGKLYFYNNTLYSIRAGNTTLVRLSTNDENADIRNNILHVTATGNRLAILESSGQAEMKNNLLKSGWRVSHSGGFSGTLMDDGSSIETSDPGFNNPGTYDFSLDPMSMSINMGTALHADVIGLHNVGMEYVKHQSGQFRPTNGVMDIGGLEYAGTVPVVLSSPFTAALSGKSVLISWTTAVEVGVDHFEIRRISEHENRSWHLLPMGAPHRYQLIDDHTVSGEAIYQLWELTHDGNELLVASDRVVIHRNEISILSNLVRNHIELNLPGNTSIRSWQILDISGRIIKNGKLNTPEIDVIDMLPGRYFLVIEGSPPLSFIKL